MNHWRMPGQYECARHFGSKIPSPPPNPAPPTEDNANVQEAAAKAATAARKRKGRGATILAGDASMSPELVSTTPSVAPQRTRLGD